MNATNNCAKTVSPYEEKDRARKAYSANFLLKKIEIIFYNELEKTHTPPRRGEPPVADKRKGQSAE